MPQIGGMYAGDRNRKVTLVEHGFRLPSALDNRPLRFEEWEQMIQQVVFVSATPGPYELEKTGGEVVEQVIRPTGLLDPEIEVVAGPRPGAAPAGTDPPAGGQPASGCWSPRSPSGWPRTWRPTSASRTSRCKWLHSELDAFERVELLRDLRAGPLRRAGGREPAPRRARPARGLAGGHPGRRQGGLPAQRDVADPDHRPRGPQRQRQGASSTPTR